MGFRAHVSIVDIPIGVVPRSRAAAVVAARNRAAQAELSRFIEAVSNSTWSVDAVRQCLCDLNQPGLVHSCYYRRSLGGPNYRRAYQKLLASDEGSTEQSGRGVITAWRSV